MIKKATNVLLILALATGLSLNLTACGGDDDDNGTENNGGDNNGGDNNGGTNNNGGDDKTDQKDAEGFLVPLSENAATATNREGCETIRQVDYSFTALNEIVNYFVNACRVSEYFLFPEFRDSKQEIGDPCFCYGEDCRYAGYERPEIEKIIGCDNVKTSIPGVVKGCFRSTDARKNHINPVIYFPQGMCTLMMAHCEELTSGARDGICNFAEFGDYSHKDEFTVCPAGSALSDFIMPIEVALSVENPEKAKLHARLCLPKCNTDADCHGAGTYDALLGETSQTHCIDVSDKCKDDSATVQPAKVCFDQRMIDQSEIGVCVVNNGESAE